MAQTIKLKRSATQGSIPATSALSLGEVAINTYDGKMYIKKSVGGTESIVEIGSGGGSGIASSFTLYEYAATSGQTTFSGSDSNSNTLAYDTATPPKILVYLNGVLLDHTTDYTATNGTSVVLTNGAATSDLLQIAAYKSSVSTTLDIDLSDNQKLLLGDDDDLQIYHDGSNSFINETGTGSLYIGAESEVQLRSYSTNEKFLVGTSNGATSLYYNGARKLDTTNTGINVIGSATIADTSSAPTALTIGSSSASNYTKQDWITSAHGTSTAYLLAYGASHSSEAGNFAIKNLVANKEIFFELSSNVQPLRLTSTGATVTGNITVSGTVDGVDIQTLNTTAGAALPKAGGTMTGAIVAAAGISGLDFSNGISGNNFNITGVNELTINDPGEGIAFGGGSTAMNLAIVDDATDRILRYSGTGAVFDVQGNITLTGTVDGRDLATDGAKLDNIESNADVTDTDNVTAAGALMDSEVTNLTQVKAFDSSDYATAAQGTTADNALPKSGGAMTGAITTNSTFDGRDVATDGTKLDGIEANADVTDTANVTAAGALMDSEVTNLAQVKAFDSSDYATAAQGSTANSALQNVVEDTTPQLGGNLDLNSNNITGTGNINITGTGTLSGQLRALGPGDATFTSTTHAFQTGATSGLNIIIDDNEIMARNNGASTNLLLQADGGNVTFRQNGLGTTNLIMGTTTFLDHSLNLSNIATISSGAITSSGDITSSGNIVSETTSGNHGIKIITGNTAEGFLIFGDAQDNSMGGMSYNNSTNTLDIDCNNSVALSFDSSQNATFAGNILSPAGTAASPALQVGDTDSGFYDSGSNSIGLALGGVKEYEFFPAQFNLQTNNLVTQGWVRAGTGTVSAPSFQVGDDDSGFYDSGANEIGVTLAGVDEYEFTPTQFNMVSNNLVTTGTISSGNITTTGYLRGPSTFTIDPSAHGDNTGTVVIAGNLQVDGTTTTINSTTLAVDDKNITLASGSANKAAANGAGITVDCGSDTDATFIYDGTHDAWSFNKDVGIGTSAPSAKLHILQTAETFNDGIKLVGTSGPISGRIYMNGEHLHIDNATAGANSGLTLDDSGNIGIGIAAPISPLHIQDTSQSQSHTYIYQGKGISVEADEAMIQLMSADSGTHGGSLLWRYGDNAFGAIANPTTDTLDFIYGVSSGNGFDLHGGGNMTSRVKALSIASDGRIGIGTDAPSANTVLHAKKGTVSTKYIDSASTVVIEATEARLQLVADNSGSNAAGVTLSNGSKHWAVHHRGPSEGNLLAFGYVDSTTTADLLNQSDPKMVIDTDGHVGVGTDDPAFRFHTYHPTTNVVGRFESGDAQVWIDLHDSNSGNYGALLGHDGAAGHLFKVADASVNTRFLVKNDGIVGIGTSNPQAQLQVNQLGIDTTTTSTTATTQVAIDTFAAATFRSARYTIQVTNSTDSTYHITEVLLIHDGTTPQITEYGTIFTGSAEATFDADISSTNVRLLATPATTDSMTFKVVRHCITV